MGMVLTLAERNETIDGLTLRYVVGDLSEPVYTASLKCRGLDKDEIRYLVMLNQFAHRSSMPYRRGDVS